MTESFPRQYAATRRFSLGVPRAFTISPDGCRVAFLRSRSGTDPVNCLWVLDLDSGTERLAADALELDAPDHDLPPREKARRERARERAGGIVSYACDRDLRVAVFALSGRVYVADLGGGGEPSVAEVPVHCPALDPRPDPAGRRVAYISDGALLVADLPVRLEGRTWVAGASLAATGGAEGPEGPGQPEGPGGPGIPGVPGVLGGRDVPEVPRGPGGPGIPGVSEVLGGRDVPEVPGGPGGPGGPGIPGVPEVLGGRDVPEVPGGPCGADPGLVLAAPENNQVTYGLPEFVAAEEMGRLRGYWWAPDGSAVLAARVDENPVQRWYIANPASPDRPPAEIAYPVTGTANAEVTLILAGLDGSRTPVDWDQVAYPYLVTVRWEDIGADGPLFVVQDRSQRQMRILRADPATGRCELVHAASDDTWLDIVPGVPAWTAAGDLVWTADADGARRLFAAPPAELADAAPVTPPDLQVRGVLDVDGDIVLFAASTEPTEIELWTYGPGGLRHIGVEPGVHSGRRAGGTTVVVSRALYRADTRVEVFREGHEGVFATIGSLAERPNLAATRLTPPAATQLTPRATAQPEIFSAGPRQLRTAVLLPSWHQPGSAMLPVLLAPYGGPGHQEVLAAGGAYLESRWFADQGFAVVIADGRGSPGRGPQWDRSIFGDLAGPVLDDQVAALHGAAERFSDLDLRRVGIRGWSFGGYLAALAVLRRPDVFHAAIAGAPVTEWRLYDTHYTERYLGHPDESKGAYERCSLLADAPRLARPLLLIHGLADDNVVAAHTLRLSSALLAAGRPHNVLPLSGVTHMASQAEVAENLLLVQADFLRHSLKHGAVQPGTVEPGAVQPGAVRPGAVEPGAVTFIKPGADEAVT